MQDLQQDLVAFLQTSIRSVWALELLLILRRGWDRTWSEREADLELRASAALVSSCLRHLERNGLAARDANGAWRYAPANAEIESLVTRLEIAQRERPWAVLNTLYSASDHKLRNFADAFRFMSKDE
jgi:hypothetical protein